mmetsp:Transcript_16926/g.55396  ORF Transcript_16926/g.55396 Transcript_16926/m.55396 type:complete len:205 (-) Transcript_16926:524-1138(-)
MKEWNDSRQRRELLRVRARGAVVCGSVVDAWAFWNDGVRIERRMTCKVMHFDMAHVHRLPDPWRLVEVFDVLVDARIPGVEEGFVGFEIHHVNLVEADQRHEEPHVRLRELIAREEAALVEDRLDPVERCEELLHRCVVRLLRRGEAASIDAVVDRGVDPRVHGVNLRAERLGVEIKVGLCRKCVEARVEDANNLARFVVHNSL